MSVPFIPGATVEVPEINFKSALELPAASSALIIVDMQNDFVKEGGTLVVPAATDTISNIQRLLLNARERGIPVAYTQDTHTEDDPEFAIWPHIAKKAPGAGRLSMNLRHSRANLSAQNGAMMVSTAPGWSTIWPMSGMLSIWSSLAQSLASVCCTRRHPLAYVGTTLLSPQMGYRR